MYQQMIGDPGGSQPSADAAAVRCRQRRKLGVAKMNKKNWRPAPVTNCSHACVILTIWPTEKLFPPINLKTRSAGLGGEKGCTIGSFAC